MHNVQHVHNMDYSDGCSYVSVIRGEFGVYSDVCILCTGCNHECNGLASKSGSNLCSVRVVGKCI